MYAVGEPHKFGISVLFEVCQAVACEGMLKYNYKLVANAGNLLKLFCHQKMFIVLTKCEASMYVP